MNLFEEKIQFCDENQGGEWQGGEQMALVLFGLFFFKLYLTWGPIYVANNSFNPTGALNIITRHHWSVAAVTFCFFHTAQRHSVTAVAKRPL